MQGREIFFEEAFCHSDIRMHTVVAQVPGASLKSTKQMKRSVDWS